MSATESQSFFEEKTVDVFWIRRSVGDLGVIMLAWVSFNYDVFVDMFEMAYYDVGNVTCTLNMI